MKLTTKHYANVVALAAIALTPGLMVAADFSLDNFATGPGKVSGVTGTHNGTETGTGIIGGSRSITLTIGGASDNPYQQPIQVQVLPSTAAGTPSALVWSVGYGSLPRIDLEYGATNSLALNLTAYNRLRVSFQGLSNVLNFNIAAWQASNNEGTAVGCNLAAYSAPFTVDFPLSDFILKGKELDWSNIEAFDIIFQGGSATGSPSLAITGFSAVPSSDPAGTFTCGPTT